MSAAPISQKSWVQIRYGPDFFSGLISNTSSVVFITARIDSIFVSSIAVHIYDFHVFIAIIPHGSLQVEWIVP